MRSTPELLKDIRLGLSLSDYFIQYSKRESRPKLSHLIFLLPLFIWKFRWNNFIIFNRFVRANKCSTTLVWNQSDIPSISVLVVTSGKDFQTLRLAIQGALLNSVNPIVRITVIVPAHEVHVVEDLLDDIGVTVPIECLSENDFYDDNFIGLLKKSYGQRAGWVLQQYLKINYVKNNGPEGVLVLDSDTIILHPTQFLDKFGNQLLMPSAEYHNPYYVLLHQLGIIPTEIPAFTFVTHHMLMQPTVLKDILKMATVDTVENLFRKTCDLIDHSEQSSQSLDYELYAQGLLQIAPEKVQIRRFCNITVQRNKETLEQVTEILKTGSSYNSISLHSYV